MTHKAIDALLASTMFLLFVIAIPNFGNIAANARLVDRASALAYSSSTYYGASSTSISTSSYTTGAAVTGSSTSASATAYNTPAISVKLSNNTPASAVLVNNQQNADLAKFDFVNSDTSNDVQIKAIAISRSGLADDSTLTDVSLYVNGAQIGQKAAFSGGKIVFSSSSALFTLAKNSTVQVEVKGSVASSGVGTKTVKVGVTSYDVKVVSTNTSFTSITSVMGNLMSIIEYRHDPLNVALTSATPSSKSFARGAKNIELARFAVSGDAYITEMEVKVSNERKSTDQTVESLTLTVQGKTIGSANMGSNNGAVFNLSANPFRTIAGSDSEIVITGNLLSNATNGATFFVSMSSISYLDPKTAVKYKDNIGLAANTMSIINSVDAASDVAFKNGGANPKVMPNAIPSITVVSPNIDLTYEVGKTINVKWDYKDIADSKSVNISILNSSTGESIKLGSTIVANRYLGYVIPRDIKLGKYKLLVGVLTDDSKSDLALDWSDQEFNIIDSFTGCDAATSQWSKVLSPNGDEVYNDGQKINVRWNSCKIPKDTPVEISLRPYNALNNSVGGAEIVLSNSTSINDGEEFVKLPKLADINKDPRFGDIVFGKHFVIIVNIGANGTIKDQSDSLFSIVKPVDYQATLPYQNKPSTGLETVAANACVNSTVPGGYTLTNEGTPKGAILSSGHPVMADFHFATISIKTDRSGSPVCLEQIQLGALNDPNLKISNVYIYNRVGTLLATVPITDWYNVTGSTWAAWVPVNLDLKGGTSMKFIIKADILDSSKLTSGLFNLGISGMNFYSPGARGSNTISFGEVFAIN